MKQQFVYSMKDSVSSVSIMVASEDHPSASPGTAASSQDLTAFLDESHTSNESEIRESENCRKLSEPKVVEQQRTREKQVAARDASWSSPLDYCRFLFFRGWQHAKTHNEGPKVANPLRFRVHAYIAF